MSRITRTFAIFCACAALAVASAPLAANAGSATSSLAVSASIAKNCTIAAGALAFGAYDPVVANATADKDQTATVTLTCTKGATGITLGMGASANDPAGCAAPARCLLSGASDYLNYQLYSDSGRSSVWTTAIAETVSGGTTTPTNVTVYGRIPHGQDAAVGATYADSVVATVNF